MKDIRIYKQKDLVLKLNKYYDPQNLNLKTKFPIIDNIVYINTVNW